MLCQKTDQMTARPCTPPRLSFDERQCLAIHEMAEWTHALTLTFLRADRYGRPCTEFAMSAAIRHFLRVLNILCFGRKRFDKGHRLFAVWAIGFGSANTHPHCHMAIAAPTAMDSPVFQRLLNKAVRKTRWFAQQHKADRYRNEGWIKYMKSHQKALHFDLPRPANPRIG